MQCYLSLGFAAGYLTALLGEVGDVPLLGRQTLSALGLVLNPFSRTLHPMRMLLA